MKLWQQLKKLCEDFYDTGTSFYVVLGFEGHQDIDKFHSTLIYFGSLNKEEQEQVKWILDEYFQQNKIEKREVVFDKVSMFGPEKDVRVLEAADASLFLPDLRERLMAYNGSQFIDYKPHLTTELPAPQTLVINRAIFSKSEYQVIQEYPLI